MFAPSDPTKPSTSEAGFSLFETIVSLAILSLALGAVFNASMMGLRGTQRAADRMDATLEARSLIDRLGIDLPLVAGTYDGKTESGRRYRVIITPVTTRASTALQAFDIEADVGARTDGRHPLVALKTLRTAKAGS